MDEQQRILEDFLKNLRIALNHAVIYLNDHPVFLKAIEELKNKLNAVFAFYDPLTIGIAPGYIVVDKLVLDKNKHCVELANILHLRKIKNIRIKKGVTVEELAYFLMTVALTPQEMTKRLSDGSLAAFRRDTHIDIEGLDYFELLKEGGDGEKDVWSYLLSQAAQKPESPEFKEFSDNFSRIIDKFKGKDFLENLALKDNLKKFLDSVKAVDAAKFGRCSKELARVILRDRTLTHDNKVGELREFFKDVDVLDLSNTLWDEIINDANFDFLTFKLFSQLVDRERRGAVAQVLAQRVEKDDILQNNTQIARRMKELFRYPAEGGTAPAYRKVLEKFLVDTVESESGTLPFDRAGAYGNYRYVLLNLLMLEVRPNNLRPALDKIVAEWGRIIEDNDATYISSLLGVLEKKKRLEPSLEKVFAEDEKRIFDFIEHKVLEEDDVAYFDLYYSLAEKAAAGYDLYLARIFHNHKVNPHVLKLFFKFFTSKMDLFYAEMKSHRRDISFLKKMVESLKQVDLPLALQALAYIFDMKNDILQFEVIRAMKYMCANSLCDEEFLLRVLPTVNMYTRREILDILLSRQKLRGRIAQALFEVDNTMGSKNQLVSENIKIAEDVGLYEAKAYLKNLAGLRSWFKQDIAARAQAALKKMEEKDGIDPKS